MLAALRCVGSEEEITEVSRTPLCREAALNLGPFGSMERLLTTETCPSN
jgi:hypothetical protein